MAMSRRLFGLERALERSARTYKAMQQFDDVVDRAADVARRWCRTGIADQKTVVAHEAGVLQGRKDATVGIDAREEQGLYTQTAKHAIEFVIPKTG